MKISGDKIIFSSGLEIYGNGGIIGLGPDGDLFTGYDGSLDYWKDDELCQLCQRDKNELAQYMICRWKEVSHDSSTD